MGMNGCVLVFRNSFRVEMLFPFVIHARGLSCLEELEPDADIVRYDEQYQDNYGLRTGRSWTCIHNFWKAAAEVLETGYCAAGEIDWPLCRTEAKRMIMSWTQPANTEPINIQKKPGPQPNWAART